MRNRDTEISEERLIRRGPVELRVFTIFSPKRGLSRDYVLEVDDIPVLGSVRADAWWLADPVEFTPGGRANWPKGMRRMASGRCFDNARSTHLRTGLRYAEGFALMKGFWFHHAWNVTPDGVVVDRTGMSDDAESADRYVGTSPTAELLSELFQHWGDADRPLSTK